MTPKAGDTVRLKVEAIERGTRTDVSRKVGLIERYELGKGDLGKEREFALALPLPPLFCLGPTRCPDVLAHLVLMKGNLCS